MEIIFLIISLFNPLIEPIISILIVSNVLPILPIVMGIGNKAPKSRRKSFFLRSLTVGYSTALVFAIAGSALFAIMGIILNDLRIAGGLVLLVFSIYDLL